MDESHMFCVLSFPVTSKSLMTSRTRETIFVDGFLVKTNEGLSSVYKLYWSKTQTACVDTVAIGQSLRKARMCKPHR